MSKSANATTASAQPSPAPHQAQQDRYQVYLYLCERLGIIPADVDAPAYLFKANVTAPLRPPKIPRKRAERKRPVLSLPPGYRYEIQTLEDEDHRLIIRTPPRDSGLKRPKDHRLRVPHYKLVRPKEWDSAAHCWKKTYEPIHFFQHIIIVESDS